MILGTNIRVLLPLLCVLLCLLELALWNNASNFREFEIALLQMQDLLLACLVVCCAFFLIATFALIDTALILLLIIAFLWHLIKPPGPQIAGVFLLFFGVSISRLVLISLHKKQNGERDLFLVGFVALLAFLPFLRPEIRGGFYNGPRWMGLWDDPNVYGSLMGAGFVLAMGLIGGIKKSKFRSQKLLLAILFIAAGIMVVGLLFSYSRGSWAGAVVGLLFLAWSYGKLQWRYVVPGLMAVATAAWLFWNATPDTAPWYIKRLDLGRPSAQHRAAAWRGGLEILQDHPLGVGWNSSVDIYAKKYSPPGDGAGAINTNDYLMLGTQLGFLGLLFFATYVGLCFNGRNQSSNQTACLASVLTLLVTFWFDGGLFKLPTAAVFWILLELGSTKVFGSSVLLVDNKARPSLL